MSRLSFVALIFAANLLAPLAYSQTLSPYGYGEVIFGAKLEEAESRLREVALPEQRNFECDFVRFTRYPKISFMVEAGIVTRADAERGVNNSAEVNVGMPMHRVKRMHPTVKVEPHKYDEKGHYVTLATPDGKAALVFEEGGGEITDVRAGLFPAVGYVERCL